MFNDFAVNKSESSNSEEIFEHRRQYCLLWAGILIGSVLRLVESSSPESLTQLKKLLIKFSDEDFSEFFANGAFYSMKAEHFFREPDQVWEESLLDDSQKKSCVECGTEISHVVTSNNVELFVRWTIPRTEFITSCTSAEKLIYIAMVIAEELLHIIQRKDPFTWRFIMFNLDVELLGIKSQDDMFDLQELRELDISYFFHSYIPISHYGFLQWYEDRTSAEDYHRIVSPSYLIDRLLKLVRKYGDIDEVYKFLSYELSQISNRDPNLSSQMKSSQSFVELQQEREN